MNDSESPSILRDAPGGKSRQENAEMGGPPLEQSGGAPLLSDSRREGLAFLLFQIGPVQEFIGQARKTRDLWSGSYLISYLCAQAIFAVQKAVRRDGAIVYPAIEESPLARFFRNEIPAFDDLRAPCLPNRFLAQVPAERGVELAGAAAAAVRCEWRRIAGAVREKLAVAFGSSHPGWDAAWKDQVARFPVIDWTLHEWRGVAASAGFPPLDPPSQALLAGARNGWARDYAMTDCLFAARKNARAFDQWPRREGDLATAHKDHLDGRSEALGGGFDGQRRFREALAKHPEFKSDFRGSQLYGALSIIKRRWDKDYLPTVFGKHDRPWFPDTGFVAQIDKDIDAEGAEAERYYAVLMMDGDDMGQWLTGAKAGAAVTGKYHRELSGKLAHFALRVARPVVEAAGGHLIYSGGDDVLAMLPAAHALGCAHALALAFRGALGSAATASAGIAIGHVRSPMQDAIQAARAAERQAKDFRGPHCAKAAFCIAVRKRSGEAVKFRAQWDSGVVEVWIELLCDSRFAPRLAQRFAARVKEQLIEGGSATGARYAKQWSATLREVIRCELRHVLRQQAGLSQEDAVDTSTRWMKSLAGSADTAAPLAPEDFLHFWLAWAFLARADSGEPTLP